VIPDLIGGTGERKNCDIHFTRIAPLHAPAKLMSFETTKLTLSVLPNQFAICRLSPDDDIPGWGKNTEFYSITRSRDELSVVCFTEDAPLNVQAERDWRALRIQGRLDFSLTGILACLLAPLAEAEISVFAISTYDTDYVLVREKSLSQAISILKKQGHSINQ
jgi:hypothetical protein